jgi:hypothetical protein
MKKFFAHLINTWLQPGESRRGTDNERFQPLFWRALKTAKAVRGLLAARTPG